MSSGRSADEIMKMDKSELHDFYHCEWCWNRFHRSLVDHNFMTREQLKGQVSGYANGSNEVRLQE
jgi:hypothetical protein